MVFNFQCKTRTGQQMSAKSGQLVSTCCCPHWQQLRERKSLWQALWRPAAMLEHWRGPWWQVAAANIGLLTTQRVHVLSRPLRRDWKSACYQNFAKHKTQLLQRYCMLEIIGWTHLLLPWACLLSADFLYWVTWEHHCAAAISFNSFSSSIPRGQWVRELRMFEPWTSRAYYTWHSKCCGP